MAEAEAEREGVAHHIHAKLREMIMEGHQLFRMLDEDLEKAWAAHAKIPAGDSRKDTVRGRIRGLAQATATVKSPFSRENLGADSAQWMAEVKRVEQEGYRRAKAKGLL